MPRYPSSFSGHTGYFGGRGCSGSSYAQAFSRHGGNQFPASSQSLRGWTPEVNAEHADYKHSGQAMHNVEFSYRDDRGFREHHNENELRLPESDYPRQGTHIRHDDHRQLYPLSESFRESVHRYLPHHVLSSVSMY